MHTSVPTDYHSATCVSILHWHDICNYICIYIHGYDNHYNESVVAFTSVVAGGSGAIVRGGILQCTGSLGICICLHVSHGVMRTVALSLLW